MQTSQLNLNKGVIHPVKLVFMHSTFYVTLCRILVSDLVVTNFFMHSLLGMTITLNVHTYHLQ